MEPPPPAPADAAGAAANVAPPASPPQMLAGLANLRQVIDATAQRLQQNPEGLNENEDENDNDFIPPLSLKTMFKLVTLQLNESREESRLLRETVDNLSSELTQLKEEMRAAAPALPDANVTQSLAKLQTEVKGLADTVGPLKGTVEKHQGLQEVVDNHQRFLEQSETFQRKKNVIMTGIAESGSDDDDMVAVRSVLTAMNADAIPEKVKRLGKPPSPDDVPPPPPAADGNPGPPRPDVPRKRPILVEFKSNDVCKEVLGKTKVLKDSEEFKTVYVKSDKPPHERKEWLRLRQVCRTEKNRPVNRGRNVKIDYRKRCVMVDDRIIDRGNFRYGPEL